MPEIQWNLVVEIAGGPQTAVAQSVSIDAYDRIEVAIPSGTGTTAVDVQPGLANQVRFLLINSNIYGTEFTYEMLAPAGGSTEGEEGAAGGD